ncbi:peptidyl-prolyl cis-trans isomerase ssp-1-like [Gossypium australe]|uniref:Peptidyl-prolyl cis-trans isomerase ssp-1-like n=1 Tax=Gossypium australe TaxID=47621 RepID=A0A5B6W1C7_9ROSI|nr:peptidyl-prolyl cis-trans isomerase ssp-1-like [Gossypium australe]
MSDVVVDSLFERDMGLGGSQDFEDDRDCNLPSDLLRMVEQDEKTDLTLQRGLFWRSIDIDRDGWRRLAQSGEFRFSQEIFDLKEERPRAAQILIKSGAYSSLATLELTMKRYDTSWGISKIKLIESDTSSVPLSGNRTMEETKCYSPEVAVGDTNFMSQGSNISLAIPEVAGSRLKIADLAILEVVRIRSKTSVWQSLRKQIEDISLAIPEFAGSRLKIADLAIPEVAGSRLKTSVWQSSDLTIPEVAGSRSKTSVWQSLKKQIEEISLAIPEFAGSRLKIADLAIPEVAGSR